MTAGTVPRVAAPRLPRARGPLSAAVLTLLTGTEPDPVDVASADPYGDDLQLALYCCYELHYRGFAEVRSELEWDVRVLAVRGRLESAFEAALRRDVTGGDDVASALDALLVEPIDAPGVSHHLMSDGELWQLREYVAHRSIYHLKEGDPQAWVIPRLEGHAKAALVSVEHDEYGAGRADRMHAQLFANMMRELGLTAEYGGYLDLVPAATLAEVNLMSLCGLHRRLRAALVGQFAVVELTSSPGSHRLVRAAERLDAGPATVSFYREHVEADAVHEQVVRRGIIAPLLTAEPELAGDVVLGIQATNLLADRLSDHLLPAWADGRSSLRRALDGTLTT